MMAHLGTWGEYQDNWCLGDNSPKIPNSIPSRGRSIKNHGGLHFFDHFGPYALFMDVMCVAWRDSEVVNEVISPCFTGYRIALIRLLRFSIWVPWLCVFCPNVQGHFCKNTMWTLPLPQIRHQLIQSKKNKERENWYLLDCLNSPFITSHKPLKVF